MIRYELIYIRTAFRIMRRIFTIIERNSTIIQMSAIYGKNYIIAKETALFMYLELIHILNRLNSGNIYIS